MASGGMPPECCYAVVTLTTDHRTVAVSPLLVLVSSLLQSQRPVASGHHWNAAAAAAEPTATTGYGWAMHHASARICVCTSLLDAFLQVDE
jgi:hypothetical protein